MRTAPFGFAGDDGGEGGAGGLIGSADDGHELAPVASARGAAIELPARDGTGFQAEPGAQLVLCQAACEARGSNCLS